MSVETFWSEKRWTRKFGAWGKDYTIVKDPRGGGYHIGLDSATVGDVPCLIAGVVVTTYKTGSMGWCVEIDTGDARVGQGRYFTYCHIAGDRIPREGERIEVGGRVGRTAMGPRAAAYTSVEFPGTAWNGVHCHLVVSDFRYAAWTIVKDRTLGAFYDPAPIIRAVLGGTPAGIDPKPFDPEGFLMALSDTQQRQMYEALVVGGPSAQAYYTTSALINILRNELAPAIASIAAGGIMYPGAGYAAFPAVINTIREDSGAPAVQVDEEALAKSLAPILASLIPQNVGSLTDGQIDQIAKAVTDEQAKRLAG